MFSFRTTSISEQLDRALVDGRVGVFCTQSCWNPDEGGYLYDLFRRRGNLAALFQPDASEMDLGENHIEFDLKQLEGLDALVVEIQDTGTRGFCYTIDVLRLMSAMLAMEEPPSLYIVDHPNPAGRIVEGTMPLVSHDVWTPLVAHRHGLTLGELCHLYSAEIGAKYPLHIISAGAYSRELMPWTVAPAADVPGFFTCHVLCGGSLWKDTGVTPGIGTPRPYEVFGAPFIELEDPSLLPPAEGCTLRPCTFTPAWGQYEGERCFGYQIILRAGEEYHSLLHALQLIRAMALRYPQQIALSDAFFARIADPVLEAYLRGNITFDIVQEHVKAEEQKWIRKAKRYLLYEDQPCRIK